MKTTFSRFLAVMLAVAMVLTCAISGFVLPVAAGEETKVDLLAGNEVVTGSHTVTTGNEMTLSTGYTLEANQYYEVYFVATVAKGEGETATPNVTVTAIHSKDSTQTIKFVATDLLYRAVIQPTAAKELKVKIASTAGTVTVKDIQLFAIDDPDSTYNYVAGGTFENGERSAFFYKGFTNVTPAEIVDDTATNKALYFSASHSAGYGLGFQYTGYPDGGVWKIQLKFKGKLRFYNGGASGNAPFVIDNSSMYRAASDYENVYFEAADWTDLTFYVDATTAATNQMQYAGIYNQYNYGSGNKNAELWIDDVQVYNLGATTEITLDKTEMTMYPNTQQQLTVSRADLGLVYNGTLGKAIPWSSSNEEVATVDKKGNITAKSVGTATITVKFHTTLLQNVYAECVVTVQEPTENEKIYFEGNTVKVDAAAGTHDLTSQLKSAEGYTPGTLTWSLTGGTTNKWNSTAVAYTGDEVTVATISATGVLTMSNPSSEWTIANVNPVVTVTDATGHRAVANVEWVYKEQVVVNSSFDANTSNWRNGSGAGISSFRNEAVGFSGAGLTTSATTSLSLYGDVHYLKPNSRYRVTFRFKSNNTAVKASIGFANSSGISIEGSKEIAADADGEWMLFDGYFLTNATPRPSYSWGFHPVVTMPSTAGDTTVAYIDEIRVELMDDDAPLFVGSDFEDGSFLRSAFTKKPQTYSLVVGSQAEGASIGGNTSKMIAVAPGKSGDGDTSVVPQLAILDPYRTYEITFRHYGAAGRFWVATYDHLSVAGTGGIDLKATEEWTEYRVQVVFGSVIDTWGQPYTLGFNSVGSEDVYYIDDFQIAEIAAPYVYMAGYENTFGTNNAKGGLHMTAMCTDGVERTFGSIGNGTSSFYPVAAGKMVTVTIVNESGYLPVPGTLKAYDADGNEISILNSAYELLEDRGNCATVGDKFKFKMPSSSVRLTCEFVSVDTQGYQWGTVGSAVRRVDQNDKNSPITGMRFLNRLYIDGLNWNADALKTTIDGKEYTIMEIGAKARVYDANAATTLYDDEKALAGVCYEDGNPNVKVTDYTLKYFDFTVVIPIAKDADHNVQYECGSYMVLRDANGNTETVYTTAMVDSVAAAVGRGA